MSGNYQPVAEPRFEVESTPDGEQIRMKAQRQVFVMLFLPVWLTGWTIGGIAAASQMLAHFEPFLAVWLCGWALGWVMAAGALLWMFCGSETLRVTGRDLEVTQQVLGLSRRWVYEGRQMARLRPAEQSPWMSNFSWQVPFFRSNRFGSVKFDYGARTIFLAPGLSDAEGRMIVDRLAKRLPSSASA